LDKVAATTNILQHESKDFGLFRLRLDGFQSVFMMCEIKCVVHGFEQGSDVVITLVLFQECLSSRRTLHEHLVWNMTQMDVPWGSLKVNCAPSLRVGKAEWKLD